MKLENFKISWYYIAIPVVLLLFCPVTFLHIRDTVSPYVVAIPANEPSLLSPVAPVFSRAPYFVIYDLRTNREKYLVNKFADAKYKVGLHVTHLIIGEKAGIVIAKNVGAEPYDHLTKRGVTIYDGPAANIQEALNKFRANQLVKINCPTGFSKLFSQG